MTMPGMPTISLRITCKGNALGDIDALPVPVSVTPAGHIVVDPPRTGHAPGRAGVRGRLAAVVRQGRVMSGRRGNTRHANGWRRQQVVARVLAAYDTCHLCGRPVDKSLSPGLPGSPEVDEIIPVSKGGSPYLFSNCRLAHRWCNRVRSNHSVAWAREHIKQTFEQGHTADLKATSMPLVTSGDW